jgi:hypothetical protein
LFGVFDEARILRRPIGREDGVPGLSLRIFFLWNRTRKTPRRGSSWDVDHAQQETDIAINRLRCSILKQLGLPVLLGRRLVNIDEGSAANFGADRRLAGNL